MKVAILMGSKSDYETVKPAITVMESFGVEVTARVLSAHRTPSEVESFISSAEDNGYEVIIGAAGKAAHLPGVIAAFTTLPVIGLPIKSSFMDGMDSLLSIVQMLSLKYPELKKGLKDYRLKMKEDILSITL
jgi:5-(carboxyamino)imidazole ribonucleotide mutase